jgi:23S rRNA (guanosine2251-2'-O)-methyltransferase
MHSAMEALSNQDRVIYEARCTSPALRQKIQSIRPELKHISIVDEHSLLRLTRGVHQGVALCCKPKTIYKKLDKDILASISRVLILNHLQDVNNIGSIIRSMVAIGFPALVTTQTGMPNIESAAIKSSSGALEHITIFQLANIRDTIKKLKEMDFFTIGLDQGGREFEGHEHEKIALVVGSEGSGMQQVVKKECDVICSLNTSDTFGVLNAAVAASIGMYLVNNF